LKPQREAPRIYRQLVAAALPRLRQHAPDSEVLVGETAPVGKPLTVPLKPNPTRACPCAGDGAASGVDLSLLPLPDEGDSASAAGDGLDV